MLEILVQGLEPEQFKQYEGISALVPDDGLEVAKVPSDWRNYPHPISTKRYGDDWVRSNRSLILGVPSAVNPLEFNYLINPEHPNFSRIEIQKPFILQLRLKDSGHVAETYTEKGMKVLYFRGDTMKDDKPISSTLYQLAMELNAAKKRTKSFDCLLTTVNCWLVPDVDSSKMLTLTDSFAPMHAAALG